MEEQPKQRLPLQPIITDVNGIKRFQGNSIVRYLLDNGGINLNQIALHGFPREDQEQFAQLIGYSVSGFGDLSYVSRDTMDIADRLAQRMEPTEEEARIAHLEEMLKETRTHLKRLIPILFNVAEEDLYEESI